MAQPKNAHILLNSFAIALAQELAAWATRVYLFMFGGWRVTAHLPQLDSGKRYILAANHQSMFDPFALFALLPFSLRRKLLPLKFMTIPKVYHRWYIKPFAYLLGCYPAHMREQHHHTHGIEGTVKLLGYGYNICIFPEGRRTLQSESDPKPGVVKIMEQYPDATLLLAHLEWARSKHGRRHITVVMGPAPQNLDKTDPKAIMNAIYEL